MQKNHHLPKNANVQDCYLYLTKQTDRLKEILQKTEQ